MLLDTTWTEEWTLYTIQLLDCIKLKTVVIVYGGGGGENQSQSVLSASVFNST